MPNLKKRVLVTLTPELFDSIQAFQKEYERRTGISHIGQSDTICYLIGHALDSLRFEFSYDGKMPHSKTQTGKYVRSTPNQLDLSLTNGAPKQHSSGPVIRPEPISPISAPTKDSSRKYPPNENVLAALKKEDGGS